MTDAATHQTDFFEAVTDERCVRIIAPHFCAAVVLGTDAAPIVRYMKGWTLEQVKAYCKRKGWLCEVLKPDATTRGIHER